ncbi:MAG TPA: hypothetical protein VFJ58_10625 [Armatimonadota bacterium]|nr:hypothetical protein [Armatimonadota bacterium]
MLRLMSFDWKGYLAIAQAMAQLGNSPTNEPHYRTAVSRAYYYAFNNAVLRLESREPNAKIERKYRGPGAHSIVWSRFGSLGSTGRRIADAGNSLKRWREWADYEEDASFEQKDATAASLRAQMIIVLLPNV